MYISLVVQRQFLRSSSTIALFRAIACIAAFQNTLNVRCDLHLTIQRCYEFSSNTNDRQWWCLGKTLELLLG
jgi:hypothetical protein